MIPETLKQAILGLRTHAELREVSAVTKFVWTRITQQQALQWAPGDHVMWESRHGRQHGIVERVNRTTVSVKVSGDADRGQLSCRWTVSPSLLRKFDGKEA